MRDALLEGPTLSNNARAKAFWAKVYAKCMSISRRQLANSTAVAAGVEVGRRVEIWPGPVCRNVGPSQDLGGIGDVAWNGVPNCIGGY